MNGMWGQFVGNLAFLGLAISLWAHLSIWFRSRLADHENAVLGAIAGGASVGSILLAIEFAPGIYIDLRFAPLALAGMFGGALSAAIAATLAIVSCSEERLSQIANLCMNGCGTVPQRLKEENIDHSQSEFRKVTASIGIAVASGHVLQTEPELLLSEAHAALYDAKVQGRNRVLIRPIADDPRAIKKVASLGENHFRVAPNGACISLRQKCWPMR